MDDAVLSSRPLFSGWLSLLMLRIRLGGTEFDRAIVEHPSGASVLAYDPDRRVALLGRQTRDAVLYLGAKPMLEALGGVSDEGEAPAETARREAFEEAGVRLEAVELVGVVWMTPSSTTERVHLFIGPYRSSDRIGEGGGADGEAEEIAVHEVPLCDLWRDIETGAMQDAKLLMLLQALHIRRPELFELETPGG